MNTPIELDDWLRIFLAQHHGTAGTIHLYENEGLKLVASVNIPPHVQQIVAWVPKGKGMAGLALERKQPIHTCNLKEDRSGNVRPGAKAVDAQAAVAVPVANAAGDVRAVVGIAFPNEREFTQAELDELIASAACVPSAPEAA
ncbi:MAG TPA: GAF domain-containing protein [Bryobacteraceae bacterium]|nr:GAF domain-containing protein [Bryobacteraceae bacterium]